MNKCDILHALHNILMKSIFRWVQNVKYIALAKCNVFKSFAHYYNQFQYVYYNQESKNPTAARSYGSRVREN